jgi:hypothetical protein
MAEEEQDPHNLADMAKDWNMVDIHAKRLAPVPTGPIARGMCV